MTEPSNTIVLSEAVDKALKRLSNAMQIPVAVLIHTDDGSYETYSNTGLSRLICSSIRGTVKGDVLCRNAHSELLESCLNLKEPLKYKCHAGLFLFAVPIVLNDLAVGAIFGGWFRELEEEPYIRKMYSSLSKQIDIPTKLLLEQFDILPIARPVDQQKVKFL